MALHASDLGAVWRRWDPHMHTPGTLLSDQFGGDWDDYLARINAASPIIEAIGVTDYFCIRGYKRMLEFKQQGRLPRVELLFPNVELRLTIETESRKPINLHLLFSPDDPEHVERIERALSNLTFPHRETTFACRVDDLERLGRMVDPTKVDSVAAMRVGANQFKASLEDIRGLFKSEQWVRENCLVAVAGTESDGPSGLQNDSSFSALREEIESFADIIFSGQRATRDFWIGRKPRFDRDFIERKYRAMKPCLHGSDAHRPERVGMPDHERRCWIKGDLTFEGLRQVVLEPEDRVQIGPECPDVGSRFERIASVSVSATSWFPTGTLNINPGLVAVIGERGSGKTALADIIAASAGIAVARTKDSFLERARTLVSGVNGRLSWGDGSASVTDLGEPDDFLTDEPARVRYLSQQFVERLCSGDSGGGELLSEVEAVIFQALDETERFGAADFSELRSTRLAPVHQERDAWLAATDEATERIAVEDSLKSGLAAEEAKVTAHTSKIDAARVELTSLIPKGQESRAKALADLEILCRVVEGRIQALKIRRQKLDELAASVRRAREIDEPQRISDWSGLLDGAGMEADQRQAFGMRFVGDVDGIIHRARLEVEASLGIASSGDPSKQRSSQPDATWSLADLRVARDQAQKDVGLDQQKAARLKRLKTDLATWASELSQFTKNVAHIQGADARRKLAVQSRRTAYAAVFESFASEQNILEELYRPLEKRLLDAGSVASKLAFVVVRHIDMDGWVAQGENLLDLRAAGTFRGRGSLRQIADIELLPAWRTGGSEQVDTAMQRFIEKHWQDLRQARPSTIPASEHTRWLKDLGKWLASTDHVSLRYSIEYERTEIQKLSPGARGIALLALYLAVDQWDHRPLLIDQPEENLDPRSVYSQLVGFFRSARQRRQVILVTHNANLVVNADVDQVIVASASRANPSELPRFSYFSGGLESEPVRKAVCDLLEGGERAFKERERRYRLR